MRIRVTCRIATEKKSAARVDKLTEEGLLLHVRCHVAREEPMALEDCEDLAARRRDPVHDPIGPDQNLAEVIARKFRDPPAGKRRRRQRAGNGDQLRRPSLRRAAILVGDEVGDRVQVGERPFRPDDRMPAAEWRAHRLLPGCPLPFHFVLIAKRCLIRLTTEAWE